MAETYDNKMSDLQKVLRMSITAQTQNNDISDTNINDQKPPDHPEHESEPSENESKFLQMPEGDKTWLKNAMEQVGAETAMDQLKILSSIIQKVKELMDSSGTDQLSIEITEEIESLFERVIYLIEEIEMPDAFVKKGGHEVVLKCLLEYKFIALAAEIIAGTAQNNPKVQQVYNNHNTVQILLGLLENPDLDLKSMQKVIYALSCLCRSFQPALNEFIKLNGVNILQKLILNDNLDFRILIKILFMLKSLVGEEEKLKVTIFEAGFMPILIAKLSKPRTEAHEYIISTLYTCMVGQDTIIEYCKQPEYNLRQLILNYRINYLNEEDNEDELSVCQNILLLLK